MARGAEPSEPPSTVCNPQAWAAVLKIPRRWRRATPNVGSAFLTQIVKAADLTQGRVGLCPIYSGLAQALRLTGLSLGQV